MENVNFITNEIISTNIKIKECNIELIMKNGMCDNKKDNNNNSKENILDIINESLHDGSMDEMIDEVLTQGTEITINDVENKIVYQFVSSDSKKNRNKTSNVSSLRECKKKFKRAI